MSNGYLLSSVQCSDTRRILRRALDAGWEWVGITKASHVEIRWPATGALVHCGTTPSDRNAWKMLAKDIKQKSGVDLLPKGNRRRSRKNPLAPDRQVQQQRAKHARQREREAAAKREAVNRREADRRQQAIAAARAADDDRHRREIEDLMRPGWGR